MKGLIPIEIIERKIYLIRGHKVMLDRDLAELYGVETRALNQAVRRNIERFPEDFMFSLSREEIMRISQIVISSGHPEKAPLKFSKNVLVFTEQGVAMLSTVLNSGRAIQVNIAPDRRKYYWYAPLLNKMMSKLITPDSFSDFHKNKVTFLTFNYDRSLEYYIHKCFTCNFSLPHDYPISGLMKDVITIHHIYGKIAPLDWQESGGLKYSGQKLLMNVESLASNVRTIYEMSEPTKENIKEELAQAEQIFFLGFSYANENLKAISLPSSLEGGSKARKIYGTALGLPKNRRDLMQQIFEYHTLPANVSIKETDCLDLLNNYLL